MTDNMVERVARAMYESTHGRWNLAPKVTADHYRMLAAKAVAAVGPVGRPEVSERMCAYCLRRVAAHFTGRRWLCDYCWEEWIDRGPE